RSSYTALRSRSSDRQVGLPPAATIDPGEAERSAEPDPDGPPVRPAGPARPGLVGAAYGAWHDGNAGLEDEAQGTLAWRRHAAVPGPFALDVNGDGPAAGEEAERGADRLWVDGVAAHGKG